MGVGDRPNLSHRAITLREYQRFTFEHSVEHSLRIPLHVFDADIHGAMTLPKKRIKAREQSRKGAKTEQAASPASTA